MSIEWYAPSTGRRKDPQISVQTGGNLSMNRGAWEELGESSYVRLGFDTDNKTIVIQATGKDDPYALETRPNKQRSNIRIYAKPFCDRYGIPYESARRWSAKVGKIEDLPVLKIRLDEPGIFVGRQRDGNDHH